MILVKSTSIFTAILTPLSDEATINVAEGAFTDAAGNLNTLQPSSIGLTMVLYLPWKLLLQF